ncbi:MAG: Protein phosphatase PrpC [Chroococcopsis gigantea SAG 12.99]|jgi:serine/threonine protein phosphatase PrpC|nr:Stp1/IreP family PP2C-type Ser/Thr phosphatase [Chlorogloea purpurea SAG 13.99]MDV3001281.1 Protein phosphatase PrpC [Chroococcopsis gigantea SAG 12.99]
MTNRSSAALSDPGLVRSVNQDSYHIDPQKRFFIVADGMGGHAGGEEASQIAVKTIQNYIDTYWHTETSSEELLQAAIKQANDNIIADQYTHPERADMGTTCVLVMFRNGQSWCAHIGDSRLYRFRDKSLEQITEDHTWVARAMKMGDLSEEQVKTHPWRHVLFQCLGRKDLRQVDVSPIDIQPGDTLILCSDGLTEEVSDAEITSYLLEENLEREEIVKNLIEAAKQAGGSDNITVVMVTED